jgi:anaerobic C4-dicarboxylate transporter
MTMKWYHIPVATAIAWTGLCFIVGCWQLYIGVMGYEATGNTNIDGGYALGALFCCPATIFVVWAVGASVLLAWWYLMKTGTKP